MKTANEQKVNPLKEMTRIAVDVLELSRRGFQESHRSHEPAEFIYNRVELYMRKCEACVQNNSILTDRRASLGSRGVVLSDVSRTTYRVCREPALSSRSSGSICRSSRALRRAATARFWVTLILPTFFPRISAVSLRLKPSM